MSTTPQLVLPETGRPKRAWRYVPALDGMRGWGAIVIIFFHAQVGGASAAFVVLDMFFVLSGFVVTNVVLSEVDFKGRLHLGRYYARRVRRLLPAAVVTIVLTCVVFVLIASQPERIQFIRQAQSALLYLANWKFIADDADYFAGDIRESPFMHFWSLSVEEQYYILFPLLIIVWYRFTAGRARVLLGVVATMMVASVVAQVVWAQIDEMRAYFGTDTRLFQLLAGVAAAVALREFARSRDAEGAVFWPRAGPVVATVAMIGFVVLGTELVEMSVSSRNLLATVATVGLIIGLYTAPHALVTRGMSLPWSVYLGQISYGVYLWHWPVIKVLERLFDVRPVVIALMTVVLATAMASISFHLLESPIRRGKVLDRIPWQTVGTGVTVSVLTALFVVGPVLSSDRAPAVAAGGAPGDAAVTRTLSDDERRLDRQLDRPVPAGLNFERISKDRGPSDTWCTPSTPEDCVVLDGEGTHIVLVGDSHARMLAPAVRKLAEERGFKLSLSVVASCPYQHGVYNGGAGRSNREQCLEARRGFYTRTLPRLDPDVVLLANLARTEKSWQGRVLTYDGAEHPLHKILASSTERTVELVNEAGASAVLVKSVMGTVGWDVEGWDPLDCLARADQRRECVVTPPLDRPLADSIYDSATITNADAATIDVNPVICPDAPVCRPLIDGQVVWRNPNHITASYLTQERDQLWKLLKGTGFFDSS